MHYSHIKLYIFGNIFSKIEKTINTFSIPKKMFLKIDDLMCVLRAHISKIIYIYLLNFSLFSLKKNILSFLSFSLSLTRWHCWPLLFQKHPSFQLKNQKPHSHLKHVLSNPHYSLLCFYSLFLSHQWRS